MPGLQRQMLITIGGSVVTGLFAGIGSALARAGPLSIFLVFASFAILIQYGLMHIVAEMCSWLPIRGSVFYFAEKWVDGALGFSAGYMYWASLLNH
ncbi:hypothetical protein L873DRAFT_22606 [Choiromyces venosus 120613-1]|uniref:Amino acid permease/ SLC12A domain-containing protein n=1 Tax=Choiromyces venosus 120613-1 TaxID=1336337 RepID=A0A3N4K6C1_9PEZI|nr:hypothetical protein L873DRAFT_22606 [Choiromyces venosus 120613-1]